LKFFIEIWQKNIVDRITRKCPNLTSPKSSYFKIKEPIIPFSDSSKKNFPHKRKLHTSTLKGKRELANIKKRPRR
jgi:hypothetical protein